MKVIDNFLPTAYQDALENVLLGGNFSWYLNPWTVEPENQAKYKNDNTVESLQFTHAIVRDGVITSENYNLVSLIAYHLMLTENVKTDAIQRIKANLNLPLSGYSDDKHFGIHTDLPVTENAITCVYYVNDCDGDTIFFDEQGQSEIFRVSPKKGRLVYFDSKIPHAGCPPRNSETRCVINFNFML